MNIKLIVYNPVQKSIGQVFHSCRKIYKEPICLVGYVLQKIHRLTFKESLLRTFQSHCLYL